MTLSIRDRTYRAYLDFLESAERKRRWSVLDDIPWEVLDASEPTEINARAVEIFCTEELYVPDYSSLGLELVRSRFALAWFQTCWAFEESKHGLAFREYLLRSGLRTEAEFESLETSVSAKVWKLPFQTPRQMACYGALQEGATYMAYRNQREKARDAGDKVLEAIFHLVGRDEAAHGGFYRAIIEIELSEDRDSTIRDLAWVLSNFKMPGDNLIPDYRQRLRDSGAGISPRTFVERVVSPLLTSLQVSRQELRQALRTGASAEPDLAGNRSGS